MPRARILALPISLFCSRGDTSHPLLPKWSQAKERDGKGFSMSYSAIKMPDLFKNLLRKLSEKCEEEGSRDAGRNVNINLFWLFDAWKLNIHICPLSRHLETQYSLQNTSEEIVHSIANNKKFKHRWISFKIAIPDADTCADTCEVFNTKAILTSAYVAHQWLWFSLISWTW